MCLLVVSFRCASGPPLVVAANRDERYARPASPMALWSLEPRLLAGRDESAGGTWLAVNELGVIAGLTNQPAAAGRDPTKRTRGELPLLLVAHDRAEAAVEAFVAAVRPRDYNPCSLVVGDRDSLYSVELRDGSPTPEVHALGSGRYVLENRPFGVPTAKTEYTRRRLEQFDLARADEPPYEPLRVLLADHHIPNGAAPPGDERRAEVTANCVHTAEYGTRSSTICFVPEGADELPTVYAAEGPPCTAPFRRVCWR